MAVKRQTTTYPPDVTIRDEQYPALSAVLDGPSGDQLRRELEQLLGHGVKKRAPRREVKRMARLKSSRYDEVVLVKDLSTSGVRLLVQGDVRLDIRDMTSIDLVVGLPSGAAAVPVSLVRMCGQDGRHIDLGFRFLSPPEELEELVSEIRSHIFGD